MRFKACLAAAAAFATVAISSAQMDLTALPPEPGEFKTKLQQCGKSLGECLAIAEDETGGKAASVQMVLNSQTPQAHVIVYTDTARHDVTVNAANGAILKHETAGRFPGWELGEQEMVTTDSGLMYFIMEEGTGKTPGGPSAVVDVHYTGYLVDGTKFDSSVDRGQTIQFPLNRVIRGWTEGVGGMKEGEKRKLVIPGNLAYGKRGSPPIIPADAMLVFDVELFEVVSGAEE